MTHFAHRAAKGPKISRYFSTAREMVCLPRGARGRLLQHGQTFTSFGSFNRTRSRARTTQHAGQGYARIVTKSPARAGPRRSNSPRRHCTSPSRGRLVEWSDQRSGIECLHFRPRRFCRRCASDASYEPVGNARSIDVTTTDISLRTDSV